MRSALFMAPKRYFRTRIPARDQRAVRPREHLLREHIEPEGTVGAFPEQMMQRRAAELHFCTFSRSALSGRVLAKSALFQGNLHFFFSNTLTMTKWIDYEFSLKNYI